MYVSLDTIAQVGITFFGITSVFLVANKNRWGVVFGLLAQPFWFMTAYINGQWGIMLLNIAYTSMWLLGIYNWFFKQKEE